VGPGQVLAQLTLPLGRFLVPADIGVKYTAYS
jgi:hypothetical protein